MTKQYNAKDIADALRDSKGMVYVAAQQLGCRPQTIYNYLKKSPLVQQAADQANGTMGDAAELKLYAAVMRGEAWAIAFYLKTKGKQRGYVERQETWNVNVPPELVQRFVAALEARGMSASDTFEEMLRELADADVDRRDPSP